MSLDDFLNTRAEQERATKERNASDEAIQRAAFAAFYTDVNERLRKLTPFLESTNISLRAHNMNLHVQYEETEPRGGEERRLLGLTLSVTRGYQQSRSRFYRVTTASMVVQFSRDHSERRSLQSEAIGPDVRPVTDLSKEKMEELIKMAVNDVWPNPG